MTTLTVLPGNEKGRKWVPVVRGLSGGMEDGVCCTGVEDSAAIASGVGLGIKIVFVF